jgi:hypothetical protein
MIRDFAAEPESDEAHSSHAASSNDDELLSRSARLAPVRAASSVQALLSTMIEGGSYSQGCTECHGDSHVHTAALRKLTAMLLRTPSSCTDVASTGGLALVLTVMSKISDSVLLCKAGAWVVSALFAGDKPGAARYKCTQYAMINL